jgi:hypothetical protein
MTIYDAVRYIEQELEALDATKCEIYSNYEALKDDRRRTKHGRSEGASLAFTYRGREAWLACDCWDTVQHNLYAIHLALQQFRKLDEWGIATTEFILRAFSTGVVSNHASQSSDVTDWMSQLGLGPTATLQDANAVYRQRAKQCSGDDDALRALNMAIADARNALG